jgi:hypothetical protein
MFFISVYFHTSFGILTYLNSVFQHIILADFYTEKFWFVLTKNFPRFWSFLQLFQQVLLAVFLQICTKEEVLQPIWGAKTSKSNLLS